ncbi:DUF4913 domain-containing protein [Frondihabitans cladoniiphilus]|uniref:DUF4913 domain-containing protein n=1 Tax=Frondihabitans cladoniiphilus TaxID=715785 RepID=A0ABP8W6X1_9MICO
MSDEPTQKDPKIDVTDTESADRELDPGADLDLLEPRPSAHSSHEEPSYEPASPIDIRGPFLDWFDQHFNTVEVSGDRERAPWCPKWWLHPEATARLLALYFAWQDVEVSLSLEARSNWWLNHWDRHRAVLFDGQTGPFRECDMTRGHLAHRMRDHDPKMATLPPDDWQPPTF